MTATPRVKPDPDPNLALAVGIQSLAGASWHAHEDFCSYKDMAKIDPGVWLPLAKRIAGLELFAESLRNRALELDSRAELNDINVTLVLLGALRRECASKMPAKTPSSATYVAYLLFPRAHQDAIVGDLEEKYAETILPRYGKTRANIWLWKQVLGSAISFIPWRITKFFALRAVFDYFVKWIGH